MNPHLDAVKLALAQPAQTANLGGQPIDVNVLKNFFGPAGDAPPEAQPHAEHIGKLHKLLSGSKELASHFMHGLLTAHRDGMEQAGWYDPNKGKPLDLKQHPAFHAGYHVGRVLMLPAHQVAEAAHLPVEMIKGHKHVGN